jgi:hypothetical protein
MTSCSPESRGRSAPLIVLIAVGALVAVGFVAGTDSTSALLTKTAASTSTITTRQACLGDAGAYTSGMIDAAKPTLRWSFTNGALPVLPTVPGEPTAPDPAKDGLLVCDPAAIAAAAGDPTAGEPGSLALVQDGEAGLVVASQPLADYFTLLLWAAPGRGSIGELASLSNRSDGRRSDELVLGISAKSVIQLEYPAAGDPAVLTSTVVPDGNAHLIAITVTAKSANGAPTLSLTVDGETATSEKSTWKPATDSGEGRGNTLTLGARPKHPSAGARVDEVTLLPAAVESGWLAKLVAADRWWVPASASQALP